MEFVETKERYLFSGVCWKDVRMILNMAAKMMQRWRPLYKQQDWGPMEHKIMQLEEKASEPSRLSWLETRGSSLSRVKVSTQNFASVDAI